MAIAAVPEKVLFFVAVLAADGNCLSQARAACETEWGQIALASSIYPFIYTHYYLPEAGDKILRAFFAFANPFARDRLPDCKLRANQLEISLAKTLNMPLSRPVNLDPGYLALDKLVLASCKDFAHRIYLRDGVFAEITLSYRNKKFTAYPWTFPDYGSGDYFAFFYAMRNYLRSLRHR